MKWKKSNWFGIKKLKKYENGKSKKNLELKNSKIWKTSTFPFSVSFVVV